MKKKDNMAIILPIENVIKKILYIRNQKVILDRDLAALYKVETRVLKQAVRRNIKRFPEDFMFQFTKDELLIWRSQTVMSKSVQKGMRHLPFAFTEHGAIMLASVLNSERAVEASVYVIRAFVRLREVLSSNKDLAQKLKELESKIEGHGEQIRDIIEAINQLLLPPEKPKRQIGFRVKEPKQKYSTK
jgi:hypothetical protein